MYQYTVLQSGHWTPLHAAAYHGNEGVVKDLVEAGANMEATDKVHWHNILLATHP